MVSVKIKPPTVLTEVKISLPSGLQSLILAFCSVDDGRWGRTWRLRQEDCDAGYSAQQSACCLSRNCFSMQLHLKPQMEVFPFLFLYLLNKLI